MTLLKTAGLGRQIYEYSDKLDRAKLQVPMTIIYTFPHGFHALPKKNNPMGRGAIAQQLVCCASKQ